MRESCQIVTLASERERRSFVDAAQASPHAARQLTFADGVETFNNDVADWCALTNIFIDGRCQSHEGSAAIVGGMTAQALTVLIREPEIARRIITGGDKRTVDEILAPALDRLAGPADLSQRDFHRAEILAQFGRMYLPVDSFRVFQHVLDAGVVC